MASPNISRVTPVTSRFTPAGINWIPRAKLFISTPPSSKNLPRVPSVRRTSPGLRGQVLGAAGSHRLSFPISFSCQSALWQPGFVTTHSHFNAERLLQRIHIVVTSASPRTGPLLAQCKPSLMGPEVAQPDHAYRKSSLYGRLIQMRRPARELHMKRILIIEDDRDIVELVRYN